MRLNCAAPSGRESPLESSANAASLDVVVARNPTDASAAEADLDRIDLRDTVASNSVLFLEVLIFADGLNAAAEEMRALEMIIDNFIFDEIALVEMPCFF